MVDFDVIDSKKPTSVGLIPDVLPEVQDIPKWQNSDKGVSSRSAFSPTEKKEAQWFVLRTTYGREKKACDYLTTQNVKTFYPTITNVREIKGKRKSVTESRLPNLFFAYGTQEQLNPLVQRNPLVPFLSYYCRYRRSGGKLTRQIITVPQREMDSLIKICETEGQEILLLGEAIHKFEKGKLVRIKEGPFRGVVGRIARYKGQQRVGIVVSNLFTAVTAYIPTDFIEIIEGYP